MPSKIQNVTIKISELPRGLVFLKIKTRDSTKMKSDSGDRRYKIRLSVTNLTAILATVGSGN